MNDLRAPILKVEGLRIALDGPDGNAHMVVEDVGFTLRPGRTLALVGESGCGKSVTALAALNLLTPPLRVVGGSMRFDDAGRTVEVAQLNPASRAMRDIRGRRIAMIFQDPMTSLDPVFTVGDQIAEGLRHHLGLSRSEAMARAVELLRRVGIPAPEARARDYPFRFSGGMRQRAMIAMAIACGPSVLIADEPTTALDVTVQAQILALLRGLGADMGMAMLLITHDLGVVAETADEVIVMYRGRIVERAGVDALFAHPAHPYTQGLLASLPPASGERRPLTPIPGQVPGVTEKLVGCPFAPRCARVEARCRREFPPVVALAPDHEVACFAHIAPEAA